MYDDEPLGPQDFLAAISSLCETENLFSESDDPWFRGRVHDKEQDVSNGSALGTTPNASYANRMSPPGIPMFYGARERDTALAEIIDPRVITNRHRVTSGAFRPSRTLQILDLSSAIELPSVFDPDLKQQERREVVLFLQGFIEDLAHPVTKDQSHHVEYVPTQVVTEYFRRVYRRGELDGIVFPSSAFQGGTSCVLFFENEQCVDDLSQLGRRPTGTAPGALVLQRDTVAVAQPIVSFKTTLRPSTDDA